MVAWPVKRMDELCEITSSKRIFRADYVSEGVPFYRGKEITEKYKGNLNVSTELFITEAKFSEIKRKFGAPKPGDLLLTSVGTLGSVYVVKQDDRFYFKDGNLTWFRNLKELDSRYLFYWIGSPHGKEELKKCTIGSSQSAFTIVLLKGMEISLPPLEEQQRIAGILSAYDELIENSQRRIEILETMARSLYREWFIHFRFPGSGRESGNEPSTRPIGHPSPNGRRDGDEGAAYAQPKKVKIVDGIPEGWEQVAFGEIYNTGSGGTPSRKRPEYFEGGSIGWIKSKELKDGFIFSTEEYITEQAVKRSSAKIFPANTVLIALYGATIGRLGILANEAATNQACCAVLQKHPAFGREFAFLTLLTNRDRIIGLRLGAAQQNISQVILRSMECVKPTDKLASEFSKRTAPIFDGILTLQRQIINLRQTRDLLLPRLLSGKEVE